MNRHDARHAPDAPARPRPGGVALPRRWLSRAGAHRVPLLGLFLGVLAPLLDRLMGAITTPGGVRGMLPLCLLALGVLLARRRHRAATFVALAYGGALALDALAKAAFRSARPHLWPSPAPRQGTGSPAGTP